MERIVLPRRPESLIPDAINLNTSNTCEREFLTVAFGPEFKASAFESMTAIMFKNTLGRAEKRLNDALRMILPTSVSLEFHLADLENNRKTVAVSIVDRHGGYVPASLRGSGLFQCCSSMATKFAGSETSKSTASWKGWL